MFSSQQYLEFSRLTIAPVDQTARAEQLLGEGKFPVMLFREVFCPCTDAYMHMDKLVVGEFLTLESAQKYVDSYPDDNISVFLGRNIPGDMSEMLLEPIDNDVPF